MKHTEESIVSHWYIFRGLQHSPIVLSVKKFYTNTDLEDCDTNVHDANDNNQFRTGYNFEDCNTYGSPAIDSACFALGTILRTATLCVIAIKQFGGFALVLI